MIEAAIYERDTRMRSMNGGLVERFELSCTPHAAPIHPAGARSRALKKRARLTINTPSSLSIRCRAVERESDAVHRSRR